MNKIAILIPYFGKWPEWIDLYLYSCELNQEIDWYFFTDCPITDRKQSNLYFKQLSFESYCHTVSLMLDIDFKPGNAYKLCGLKPFYGFIHSDIVSKYKFWGYGDIDIIWGDIASFYSDKLLKNYDVFSTHADRLSGHLTILRNIPKYTEACFQIKNWQAKLESEKNIPLDEQDFSWLVFPESKYITKFYSKIIRNIFNWNNAWVLYYRVMPLINWALQLRKKRLFFKEQHTTPILGGDEIKIKHDSDEWIYKEGKVFNARNGKEYIYLHFMIFKKNSFRSDYYWKGNNFHLPRGYDFANGVIINKKGFHMTDSILTP